MGKTVSEWKELSMSLIMRLCKSISQSEWKELSMSLIMRLCKPISQPAFFFFFAVSMLIGSTGIWVAIAEVWLLSVPPIDSSTWNLIWADPSVSKSILTFFVALGSLSCIQVIVVEDKDKNLRALHSLVLIIFIGLAVLATLMEYKTPGGGNPYLIAGTILAIVTWWLANSDEAKFKQPRYTDPLGGDSEIEAAGNTAGFTT